MTALNYRADVDGLRGAAILAVLAYHGFPGWIGCGLIGWFELLPLELVHLG
jgi:peptidoglycan/LPS O-acetylase OafA/YrhL